MANNIIVSVPAELKDIKSELIFGLTKRQLIGFGITAIVAIPFFILTKDISLEFAMYGSFILGAPILFFSLYKKEKLPSEKWVKSLIEHKVLFNRKRLYKVTAKNREVAIRRGFIKNEK